MRAKTLWVCNLSGLGLGLCPHLRKERGLVLAGCQSGVFSMTQGQVGLRGRKEALLQSGPHPSCLPLGSRALALGSHACLDTCGSWKHLSVQCPTEEGDCSKAHTLSEPTECR